jgi:hypothetical protein
MGWAQYGDDGPGVDLTPLLTWLLTPTGLLSLLATLVVVLVAVVVTLLLVRRAVRRRLPAARRLLDRAQVTWRAERLPAGPRRDLAVLRRRLTAAMAATRASLTDAPPRGFGDVSLLGSRLAAVAADLDAALTGWEHEDSDRRLAAALPRLRAQVDAVCEASARLREAARGADAELLDDRTRALAADIDDEIAGIAAGTAYLRDQLRTQGWHR